MIDRKLLEILVCPENHTSLLVADEPLMRKVNHAITDGQVRNKGGRPVSEPLQGGLVRQDHAVLYPIVDDIPMMLIDEAIPLGQID